MSDKPTITNETPLRLAAAAEIAFPGGGMTASGLRREAERGRLVIERIAGKDYTTLAAIADMRKLCQIAPKRTEPVRTFEAEPDMAALRLMMQIYQSEDDAKLKTASMTKRERDALEWCFRSKGSFVDVDGFWNRTIRWLDLRKLLEVRIERSGMTARITLAGEAEWQRIAARYGTSDGL